jgi:chromosome segregation ATPase
MSRRGSSHTNPLHTVHGLLRGFRGLFEATDALTGAPPATASEADVQNVVSAAARIKPMLKVVNDLEEALDAVVELDLEIEPRRAAAEHELNEITDAVRVKASRASELAEEIQRLTVTVDAKRVEAAELDARIKEYRATIAAI